MRRTRRKFRSAPPLLALLACACAPHGYRPTPVQLDLSTPADARALEARDPFAASGPGIVVPTPSSDSQAPAASAAASGPLELREVLDSVISRYPPYLSVLLERDLASGRLLQAMGAFDANLTAKIGGEVAGYYESTIGQGMVEQALATGDTIYGGYRISDGGLPLYDKDRTQDGGELVFGGRIPLLRDRAFDRRRAGVRQAEIDAQLADPRIQAARIDYVRAASRTYFAWLAAGRRRAVAQELLRLAADRVEGLARGVERQFLAPIDLTDNERLIAQRRITLLKAERLLQQTALELSLFLRDATDHPLIVGPERLPAEMPTPQPGTASLDDDVATALQRRPDLRQLQLQIDRTRTDLDLAENQSMPNVDLVVEATNSLSDGPYSDIEELELFVGGELKVPVQRRDARGRAEQAKVRLQQLDYQRQFARDRIVNEVVDARSAMRAAFAQVEAAQRNVQLARELVAAEQRAFDLGRSDLLRIQLREVQLADAQNLEVEAWLACHRAGVNLRAVLGLDAQAQP